MPFLFDAFKTPFQKGTADTSFAEVMQEMNAALANLKLAGLILERKPFATPTQDGKIRVICPLAGSEKPDKKHLDNAAEQIKHAMNEILERHGLAVIKLSGEPNLTNTINLPKYLAGQQSEKHLTLYYEA